MSRLGPLEQVGKWWVIGDPKRKEGSCVVLTPEGLEHRVRAEPEPLSVVPWRRFVDLRVQSTARAWMATRTGGFLELGNPSYLPQRGGRSACSESGGVRHPYEGWSVNYTHHQRTYPGRDVYLLPLLIRRISEAKELHRLGDPDWVSEAVTRVSALDIRWAPRVRRQLTELVEDLTS